MKQTLLLAAIALCGLACQNQSINESRAVDAGNTAILVNRRLFTEVPLSNKEFCTGGTGENCAEKLQKLQLQLMKLNPIPVPEQGNVATLSMTEATSRYKKFVADHQGEPVLALFKQLYPRVLLNQYGVLASKDYPLISYYAQQMTEANSQDFATLTKSLVLLQNQILADQFSELLNATLKEASEYKIWQDKAIETLNKQVSAPSGTTHSGTLSPAFMKEGRKRVLVEYKKSTISADLAQLRRLEGASID